MPDPAETEPQRDRPPPRLGRFILLAGALFALVLVAGTLLRLHARHQLHAQTLAAAIPTVTIVHPGGMATDRLVLPGRLQAWYSAPAYARTNGYLRRWYVDIGQKVQQGQLLADIDTPDVDQQLAAARAALATRTAQRDLARITTRRWDRLNAQNAVSQQETDERRGNFAASEATRHEAAAEVDRLETLSGFKHIMAPFTGVVTSRATDIGALIVAGTSAAQPLFTVSDVARLRLYVSVPQAYAARMHDGMVVAFTVPDYPGRTFQAHLIHASDAVDPQSGAMLVQLVYDNAENLLKPGAYAQIAFTFPGTGTAAAVRIPASSLLFRRDNTTVAVMDSSHHVRIQPIAIVTDFGTELEVTGLPPQSAVIDNPRDDLRDGDEVKPQQPDHPHGA
ncbi:efflux RND transporter periplasmic adaptor subunit [Gluconacetobacter takamatsuzukensis]|uniref:Efflux RND transporter periplasmic adaptor subunit n=1 Tax=Gluconacetobacter takamatsuzukensis TaxID=1286190 RepID=A0A7W4PQ78_9PROT|nr:efflux RND transporter periplasmic adaptor subunit [Gluconacetobacter takamatsuzukensis]MBB2206033.1 efflux RND transporter periplasmic adaptor subunit [Gluconacetobacter takamatsuzukensis]